MAEVLTIEEQDRLDAIQKHLEDWGLCVNGESPNDGRLTFEHTGCEAHSDLHDPTSIPVSEGES